MSGRFTGILHSRETLPIRILHILVLWGFAIAQPLYDIFAQYADFFVAHDAQPHDLFLLALMLSVGLPLLLAPPLFFAAYINRNFGAALYHCVLGALVMLLALLFLKRFGNFPDVFIIVLAALIAIGFLYTYMRFNPVRSAVTWIGISIVVFPIQFLIFSPVKQIAFPEQDVKRSMHIVRSETPIIFLVFEELPLNSLLDEKGLIDSVRYPNFYKLSKKSHWFRNYTVNATRTKLSVPTIMTGKYPTHQKVMVAENHPESLFSLLTPTYRVVGEGLSRGLIPKKYQGSEEAPRQVSSKQRVPYMLLDMSLVYLHMTIPDGFSRSLPPVTDNWNQFFSPDILIDSSRAIDAQENGVDNLSAAKQRSYTWKGVAFDNFMEALTISPQPTLYYLHSTYAHNAWSFSTSGRSYGEQRMPGYLRDKPTVYSVFGFGGKRWSDDEWLVTQAYQRHLLEVSRIDSMVGAVMARLEELDIFDKSLIIVTSDHGCSFEPGGRNRGDLETVGGDTMAVPLLIKLPYQDKGMISDENTESIDILPTISDVLDIDLAWRVDGQSMFNDTAKKREQKTLIYSNENGELQKLSIDGANESRDTRLQTKLTKFGSGHTRPNGYFSIGPYGSLVGKKVMEFPVDATGKESVTIHFKEHSVFGNVDLQNSGFIPVRVSGSILNKALGDEPVHLAVEINGKIEATTRSFSERSSDLTEFYAIFSEQALRKGSNEVNFFVISTDDDNRVHLSPAIQANQ